MVRLIGLLLVFASLVACNTLDGMGKDIEEAGEAIQDSSK